MRRRDRDVVVQAESHGAVPFGMVAGRPHERHGRSMRSAHDAFDGIDRRACGKQRDLMRLRRGVRVGVECHRPPRRFRDPAQVIVIVDAGELLARRGARRDDVGSAFAPVAPQ